MGETKPKGIAGLKETNKQTFTISLTSGMGQSMAYLRLLFDFLNSDLENKNHQDDEGIKRFCFAN